MTNRAMTTATSPPPRLDGGDGDKDTGTLAEQFPLITRRMSRALLRHPNLDSFAENPRAMLAALHEFFAQWSARQQRAALLSLSSAQLQCLLSYGESTVRRGTVPGTALARARTHAELIAASPLIAIATLASELQGLEVPVTLLPLVEVVELAHVLDNAQRLVTPVGAVNLVHLVALGASLCPAPDLKTLILTVATSLHHRLLCSAIFYEWSLLDRTNAKELHELSKRIEQQQQQQEACDGRLGDDVASLITGEFEDLGNRPADPAMTLTTMDGNPPSVRSSGISSSPGTQHQNTERILSPQLQQDNSNEDSSRDSLVEEDDASGTACTVDMEFWRRLCS